MQIAIIQITLFFTTVNFFGDHCFFLVWKCNDEIVPWLGFSIILLLFFLCAKMLCCNVKQVLVYVHIVPNQSLLLVIWDLAFIFMLRDGLKALGQTNGARPCALNTCRNQSSTIILCSLFFLCLFVWLVTLCRILVAYKCCWHGLCINACNLNMLVYTFVSIIPM